MTEFTREEIFDYLGYSKWQRFECDSPIGMLGRKVPSFHCKGKKETIRAVRVSQSTWQFIAYCDCGWGYEREAGNGFISQGWSPQLSKLAGKELKRLKAERRSWPAAQQKNYAALVKRMRAGADLIRERRLKAGSLANWVTKSEAQKLPAARRRSSIPTSSLLRNPWNVSDIIQRRKSYTPAQRKRYGLK